MASTYSLQYKRRDRHTIQAVQNQTLKQRIRRGYFLQISAVFVAYVIAGKLGQATVNIRSSNLGPVWPAYGIALAGILICGYRVWLGVAAGAFLVAFFSPVSHIAALGQAAGASLAATTGAFLLHRTAKFHSSLSRLSDVLSLIALGGFGSAIVSASLGVAVLYATHVHAYSGLGAAWLIYWLGDATGVLLVTPLVLRFKDFSKLPARDRITELAILLLLLAATCSVIFGDLPIYSSQAAFGVRRPPTHNVGSHSFQRGRNSIFDPDRRCDGYRWNRLGFRAVHEQHYICKCCSVGRVLRGAFSIGFVIGGGDRRT